MIHWKTLTAAAVMAVGMFAGAAQAVPITFDRITNNSAFDAAGQFLLEVTDDAANGRALFEFTVVTVPMNPQNGASITEIYFSDLGGLFTPPPVIVSQSLGVTYEDPAGSNSPGNVPGANGANPDFVTTAGLAAEAAGNNATGINLGEILRLGLNYASGVSFAALLADLESGDFRVALHVRSLAGGQSDSFVNLPPVPVPVPVPAAGLMLLGALGGLAALRRRRRAA